MFNDLGFDHPMDEERLAWRLAQTNVNIRSMANDFLLGYTDQCNEDAAREYSRRWPKNRRSREIRMFLRHMSGLDLQH